MAVPPGRMPPGPPPPGLMAMLQGGGPPPGGPPGPGPGGPPGGDPDQDPAFTQDIKTAIQALHHALGSGEDDNGKQLASECLAKLQGLLGTHQKQQDAALGVTDVHRGVRRAIRGAAAAGGPGGP